MLQAPFRFEMIKMRIAGSGSRLLAQNGFFGYNSGIRVSHEIPLNFLCGKPAKGTRRKRHVRFGRRG
jgi:hypothetical protein